MSIKEGNLQMSSTHRILAAIRKFIEICMIWLIPSMYAYEVLLWIHEMARDLAVGFLR